MLETQILPNGRAFGEALSADLQDASSLSIAVAFAKESALSALDIEGWCRKGRNLRLLAGTDFALTELQLLRRLETTGVADCRVHHSAGGQMFHPKLYFLERGVKRVAYVGSSNFTRGGLNDNIEANVRLEAPTGHQSIDEIGHVFDRMFNGEFATPLSPEFEAGYRVLQDALREAQSGLNIPDIADRFRIADNFLLGGYRARVAVQRWLLVVSPQNFETCMRYRLWGRQQQSEVTAYSPGDVFLFHVTEGRGVAALAMFTGQPFYDPAPLWPANRRGNFPWRVRFVPLAELRTGISTREILQPLRVAAPKNWFHGFIQQSHTLSEDDFNALMAEVKTRTRYAQFPRY
jgi:HKD family nuclease